MNRSSKTFRVIGALFALANLVVAAFPFTLRTHTNYPAQTANAYQYIQKLIMGRTLPLENVPMTSNQMIFIVVCLLLPLLLALFAGIFGIFGDYKQKISIILSALMFVLLAVAFFKSDILWADTTLSEISYEAEIGGKLFLIMSGISLLSGVIGLIRTPKFKSSSESYKEIPEVRETKEEQIKAKYSMITEDAPAMAQTSAPQYQEFGNTQSMQTSAAESYAVSQTDIKPFVSNPARGVLVGLRGIYASAEIPMQDGETISFGRSTDNDLVFPDQNSVSRNHCRITWNQRTGNYMFVDYSSNGSFVYGSTDCLPSNIEIEIQAGTAIMIGDETNVFRLS